MNKNKNAAMIGYAESKNNEEQLKEGAIGHCLFSHNNQEQSSLMLLDNT